MSERVREGEADNPTIHCKHVSLGQYKVLTGTYKGSVKSKQARCKYCAIRLKIRNQKGVSPPLVFAVAIMILLCVKNSIVGNAI
jgi:hypothetical protein